MTDKVTHAYRAMTQLMDARQKLGNVEAILDAVLNDAIAASVEAGEHIGYVKMTIVNRELDKTLLQAIQAVSTGLTESDE